MDFRKSCSIVVIALLAALAVPLAAQEFTPEQQKAIDAFSKLMALGEHNEFLKNLAGEWKVTTAMWMAPGAPPVSSEGTMSGKMILGGRFLELEFKAVMMGQPFEGLQIIGYDPVRKAYRSLWLDNTSSLFYESEGSRAPGANAMHDRGSWYDPTIGKESPVHLVTTVVGPDAYTMEMFMVGEGGVETKTMEYRAFRAK